MRKLTVAIAALLVVLAVSGIAGAAVLTLSVDFAATTLSVDGLSGPMSTTYSVYGLVTANSQTNTVAEPDYTFYGGLKGWKVDMVYSGVGTASPGSSVTVNPLYSTGFTPPTILPAGTGYQGIRGAGGAIANFTSNQDYLPTSPNYSTRFMAGNELGGYDPAGRVLMFTGTINAVAAGSVTVSTNSITTSSRICTLQATAYTNLIYSTQVAALPVVTVLTINPAGGVTNEAPVLDSVNPLAVVENDWSKEPGWNNPAHTVVITAAGHDPDNGPVTPLSFIYTLTNPNNAKAFAVTDGDSNGVLNLTIGEIIAKFGLGDLPATKGIPGYVYDWDLAVQAYDGALASNTIHVPVYVPEPATMGLLAFGVVGLLKRRRRA